MGEHRAKAQARSESLLHRKASALTGPGGGPPTLVRGGVGGGPPGAPIGGMGGGGVAAATKTDSESRQDKEERER